MKLGIRDLKAKSGGVWGLKVCPGGGIPKITLEITGLHETLRRDYGIEEPYWGPSLKAKAPKGKFKDFSYGNRILKQIAPRGGTAIEVSFEWSHNYNFVHS